MEIWVVVLILATVLAVIANIILGSTIDQDLI